MTQPDAPVIDQKQDAGDPPVDDKTFTQAEVNAILAKEKRASKPADYDDFRKKAAEFDKLQEAAKTEQQKAADAAAATERRAAEAESRAMRLEVAFEKGLTPAQAKRLVGSSREELEADADEILVDFPVKTDGRPKGDADQGVRTAPPPSNPRSADLAQIEADLKASKRR